jgi:hypothetical protein
MQIKIALTRRCRCLSRADGARWWAAAAAALACGEEACQLIARGYWEKFTTHGFQHSHLRCCDVGVTRARSVCGGDCGGGRRIVTCTRCIVGEKWRGYGGLRDLSVTHTLFTMEPAAVLTVADLRGRAISNWVQDVTLHVPFQRSPHMQEVQLNAQIVLPGVLFEYQLSRAVYEGTAAGGVKWWFREPDTIREHCEFIFCAIWMMKGKKKGCIFPVSPMTLLNCFARLPAPNTGAW